ncbi:MAG: hypothetical protein M1823_007130, partial [Watsoniomyces obsoletus]
MDFVALASLVSIVCRITLDEGFMSTAAISAKVEALLQTLISLPDKEARDHVTDCILNDMGQHLHAPNLQSQLLTHLVPTSPTACNLRIKLAFMFLLGPESSSLLPNIPSTNLLDALTAHLASSPYFDTSPRNARTLNYAHLRARTSLLDIAISDGHQPQSFAAVDNEGITEPIFNASVDSLADAIKAKYTSISDSGASHMMRTEAKDALVAVYLRVMVA